MSEENQKETHGGFKGRFKRALPILAVIAGTGMLLAFLFALMPEPDKKPPETPVPLLEAIRVQPESLQLTVHSQGTVLPRTETMLVSEVTGQIIEVSPNLHAGGFFEKGEVLAQVDPADYEAALAARRAELAQAKLALAQEEAAAEQARRDWDRLGEGEPSDLTLRKPQLEQARAAVASAEAAVAKAERDLAKTRIRAPYDGRVLEKLADLGQFVMGGAGSGIARIYGTDFAEVRLPLTDNKLAYLELPMDRSFAADGNQEGTAFPQVRLQGRVAGDTHTWEGRIDRMEGTVDPTSRQRFAVGLVQNPYGGDGPPLKRGMYVEAEIEGKRIEDAYELPRYALRANGAVYVIRPLEEQPAGANGEFASKPEATLHKVSVDVIQTTPNKAIVRGLVPGALVCISPVNLFIEGMKVRYEQVNPGAVEMGSEPPSEAQNIQEDMQ